MVYSVTHRKQANKRKRLTHYKERLTQEAETFQFQVFSFVVLRIFVGWTLVIVNKKFY